MTESTHISLLDIDLEAAAAAFGSGGEKPAEKGNEDGALENVDLTITAAGMDFPGALALINGLTFEVMHPELVTTPVPDSGDNLPDWLKSNEPESPAPLQEEPAPGGPTAEETTAGLAAAEAEEPADEPDEEEVEGQVKSGLSKFLESVPWKRIVLEGTTIITPMVFGGLLGYLNPETARNISLATGTAGIGLAFTSMAAAMAERILPAHVRAGLLGRALVGAKVAGMYGGNVLLSAAIGTHVGAGIREGIEALHAAQPVVTGGGEGLVDHPPVAQPIPEVAPGNVLPHPGGEIPAEDLLPQPGNAELLSQQAAEAARIAALQQGPTVAELAAQMPNQTVSEAIYQMIGDVPHRLEVTHTIFRAIGDKVNNLNEGAIKAAAEALRPVFENIDKVMANSGTVYTEGGRAVVEIAKGFNSPEAQAIRAANMGDLEAAGNLLNNVIDPVIR